MPIAAQTAEQSDTESVVAKPLASTLDAERPLWSPMDTCTWRITLGPTTFNPAEARYRRTITIVGRRGDQYRADVTTVPVQGTGGQETSTGNWGISSDLNTYYRENADLPYTELRFLQWPMTVGKTWTFEHPLADGGSFAWKATVARWEDVAVPAGRFRALVVEIEGQTKGGSIARQVRTIWYAPVTKSKVREVWYRQIRGHTTRLEQYELESYSLH